LVLALRGGSRVLVLVLDLVLVRVALVPVLVWWLVSVARGWSVVVTTTTTAATTTTTTRTSWLLLLSGKRVVLVGVLQVGAAVSVLILAISGTLEGLWRGRRVAKTGEVVGIRIFIGPRTGPQSSQNVLLTTPAPATAVVVEQVVGEDVWSRSTTTCKNDVHITRENYLKQYYTITVHILSLSNRSSYAVNMSISHF
jgi:hypothetical protein